MLRCQKTLASERHDGIRMPHEVWGYRMISDHMRARMAAGNAAYYAGMRACVELGLLVGLPNRLTPGETVVTRARKELAHMKEIDRVLGAVGEATHADRFRELHGKSLEFYDRVMSVDYEVCEENIKMLQLQKDCGGQVMRIAARVAIEVYRGSKADVVLEMYRELQAAKAAAGAPVIDAEPMDDEGMPEDFGR